MLQCGVWVGDWVAKMILFWEGSIWYSLVGVSTDVVAVCRPDAVLSICKSVGPAAYAGFSCGNGFGIDFRFSIGIDSSCLPGSSG